VEYSRMLIREALLMRFLDSVIAYWEQLAPCCVCLRSPFLSVAFLVSCSALFRTSSSSRPRPFSAEGTVFTQQGISPFPANSAAVPVVESCL